MVQHLLGGSLDNQVLPKGGLLQQEHLLTMFYYLDIRGLNREEYAMEVRTFNTNEVRVVLTDLNRRTPVNAVVV